MNPTVSTHYNVDLITLSVHRMHNNERMRVLKSTRYTFVNEL